MPPTNYIPRYIIIHHSGADAPTPQFDAINEWHKARHFAQSRSGLYVGYHRVIEKDGTVKTARTDLERDCDALGHNFDSLSVCLVGNFDVSDPTKEQTVALASMLSAWCSKYLIGLDSIFPHRRFSPKTCYGSRLGDNWARIAYLDHEIDRLETLRASYAQ